MKQRIISWYCGLARRLLVALTLTILISGMGVRSLSGKAVRTDATVTVVDVIVSQYTYLHSRGFVTAAQLAKAQKQAAEIRALTPADRGHGGSLLGAPAAYWLDLKQYHPTRVAQRLTIPMLIMQGARDYQVTLADFHGWMATLAGHPHVTFKGCTNLFHPFIPMPSGSPPGLATPDAYNHAGHVNPNVVHDLITWLMNHSRQ